MISIKILKGLKFSKSQSLQWLLLIVATNSEHLMMMKQAKPSRPWWTNCFCQVSILPERVWKIYNIRKVKNTLSLLESSFACSKFASLDCPYAILSLYLQIKDHYLQFNQHSIPMKNHKYTYIFSSLSLSKSIPIGYVWWWATDDKFTMRPSIPVDLAVAFIVSRRRLVSRKCPDKTTVSTRQ